jgi:hypothetical protein
MGQECNEKCFLSTDQSIHPSTHPSILHGVLVAASLCSKEGGHWAGWRIIGYLPLFATDPQMKFPQLLSISAEFGNFLKEEICMS